MIRLIVQRTGRRVFGWAYSQIGRQQAYSVELTLGDEIVAQQVASLTLSVGNPLIPADKLRMHGFEFVVSPDHVQPDAKQLFVRVAQDGQSKPVPAPEDRVAALFHVFT